MTHLDGLRGLAVLLVVTYHWTNPFAPVFTGGYIGVDIFFVLSGFLITALLVRRPQSYRSFMVRRARRLLPALFAMLIVSTVLAFVAGGPVIGRRAAWSALLAGAQLTGAATANGGEVFMFGHTWSLSVEWYFYAFWPFVARRLVQIPPRSAAGALALPAVALWLATWPMNAVAAYNGPCARFSELCVGAAAAFWVQAGSANPRGRHLPLLTTAVILWGVVGPGADFWGFRVLAVPVVTVWAALVIISPPHGHLKWLTWRPLTAIGRVSYSVYLWHYSLLILCSQFVPGFNGAYVLATVLPLTIVASLASYALLERPVLRRRPQARASAPSTPSVASELQINLRTATGPLATPSLVASAAQTDLPSS